MTTTIPTTKNKRLNSLPAYLFLTMKTMPLYFGDDLETFPGLGFLSDAPKNLRFQFPYVSDGVVYLKRSTDMGQGKLRISLLVSNPAQ